jgi:hypothetical protein
MKKFLIILIIGWCSCYNKTSVPSPQKNDSSIVQYRVHKFQDGRTDSVGYIGKEQNGWRFVFRRDGSLWFKNYYVHNKKEGDEIYFYDDGISIEYKSTMKGDKQVGATYFYYQNGNMRQYEMYDDFGDLFFIMKFDSISNRPQVEPGFVVSQTLLVDKDKYYAMDSFDIIFSVAQPPNTIQKVFSGRKGARLDTLAIKNNHAEYKGKFFQEGHYTQETVMELFDLSGKPLKKRDTIVNDFYVYPLYAPKDK